MNSQKVSIDTSGDVSHDEANLFQKAMQQTSGKKAAGAKLLKRISSELVKGKPGKRGDGKRGDPEGESQRPRPEEPEEPCDEEVAVTCMMLYGHEVDLGKCGACYGEVAPHYNEEAMMEDPNAMVRMLGDMADECMGQTNQIASVCEEHYGEDVPLFDCMMCGQICQCDMEGCPDPECHPGCMAGDEEGGATFDSSYEGDSGCECQLFYGPEADPGQCEECGHQCMDEANGAVEELAMSGAEVGMEDFEHTWFEKMISCSDACMAPLVNLPEQACKAHYGEDVDLVACYTCGMMCGCDLDGNCEWCDHAGCMAGDFSGSDSSSWSSSHQYPSSTSSTWGGSSTGTWTTSSYWLQKMQKGASRVVHPMHKSKFMHKSFQAEMAKIAKLPKKQISDETDLVQTSKHLK